MQRKPADGTFELGLVMAGAVSAGAYTAGVLDFLFEALDQWEEAKRTASPDVPDHAVQIRAITGTSAGGIAGALTAMLPFTGHHPIRDLASARGPAAPANAERNLLYRCWVKDIDLLAMLETSDIEGDSVPSILNGGALSKVADAAVDDVRVPGGDGKRAYFANPLQLYLCLTNMRGVPYLIHMIADDGIRGHRVTTHGDYAHFAVFDTNHGQSEGLPAGASAVNWPGTAGQDDGWNRVKAAALATSAFPVGLPARPFSNDLRLYEAKPWSRPPGVPGDSYLTRIAPDAPPHLMQPLPFWCLDGGLINNEPLELARVALSGGPDVHNDRRSVAADRAVLMIDPFPDDTGQILSEHGETPDLFASALSIIPALKTHARFKPEEIALAPRRSGKATDETDLASDGLAGFAGFADAAFRMHDFQLGRRNCQKFLRDRLVIHRENPIVREWVLRLEKAGALAKHHPQYRALSGVVAPDTNYVRLIPQCGTACDEVETVPWPRLDQKTVRNRLETAIEQRANAVAPALISKVFSAFDAGERGLLAGLMKTAAVRKLRKGIASTALDRILEDMRKRNLVS